MKRTIDITISLLLLLICSPLIFGAGLVVKMTMGSPILFKQERPGLHEKPFHLYKLRTMIDGENVPDEMRVTKSGKFLRKYSLDEFPQLINVVKGDMSLVGPRPLLMEYLPLYTKEQAMRHEVRPGITGWAQVNGRNSISWEEKFQYDTWYVRNHSLMLDTKILWRTIRKVMKKEGITPEGRGAMEKFTGSRKVM
ncbi:sugar transferase [Halobacillus sp. A1]|uniref:sugar transferase n=1 Tax=Halobacillus sp. A1 TaxID=2880262 RepID=UPI0020A6C34F|nr:sugar transferase [Halobacillus sp. A1]MCP3030047.1 sugar transferase [Halobacillus sp. A1]